MLIKFGDGLMISWNLILNLVDWIMCDFYGLIFEGDEDICVENIELYWIGG